MGGKKNKASLKELHWIISKELQNEAQQVLFRKSKRQIFLPERGFLGVIHSGEGIVRRSLFLRKIIPQHKEWVKWTKSGLSFDPAYFSKAIDLISDSQPGAGLIIVHSHPFGGSLDVPPQPSAPDLHHERFLLYHLARALPPGSPVAAGILDSSMAWRVREYYWSNEDFTSARSGMFKGSFSDATAVRIVSSDGITVNHHGKSCNNVNLTAVDSTLRLWGKEGHKILGSLRVGIAGLGGVGSILAEYLARLGVGELILVDYDVVKEENLNRLVGVQRNEVGKAKIKYAARIARAASTAQSFKIRSFRGSVAEQTGLKNLLDADVIMNAADSAFARQVLDHVSYSYSIPVVDGGTVLVVAKDGKIIGKSQVGQAGPGQPCLECSGAYSQDEATIAREEPVMQGPRGYLQMAGQESKHGTDIPRAPSVISYNGLVAALMVQRLLSIVLPFPPEGKRGQQRYYVELGELNWGPTTHCKVGCPKHNWIGLGDSHPVPVGIDPFWKQMREQEKSLVKVKNSAHKKSRRRQRGMKN